MASTGLNVPSLVVPAISGESGLHTSDAKTAFAQAQLARNENFFNSDVAFNSAFRTLATHLAGAKVSVVKGKGGGAAVKGGDGAVGTDAFNLYITRVFTPLLAPIMRAVWITGFVGWRIGTVDEFKVPRLLHFSHFVPAVHVTVQTEVRYVGLMPDMIAIDPTVTMFSREQPTFTGNVVSLASTLYPQWDEHVVMRRTQVRMERLRAQNVLVVQNAPTQKTTETREIMYGDGDVFAETAAEKYYTEQSDLSTFWAHTDTERDRMKEAGIIAPVLMPIPAQYQVTNPSHPTMHTDLVKVEMERRRALFALCGVPESILVSTGGGHASDSTLSRETMNTTLAYVSGFLAEAFKTIYISMYPDDTDIAFNIETKALLSAEQIEIAGDRGFISEKVFAELYLKQANIPASYMYQHLSSKPVEPEETAAATLAPSKKKAKTAPKANAK